MVLPELKKLRNKSRKLDIQPDNYFSKANEFIELEEIFNTDFMRTIVLWIDMILYPAYILYRVLLGEFSPMFTLSLVKTYQLWIDWVRFEELKDEIRLWTLKVKSVGGPWVSSNDSKYHVVVYADSMERILLSRHSTRSEKLTKRP
jgi:hypothetical protein